MYIMSGDIAVVSYDPETFEYRITERDRAPLYITNRGDVYSWICSRAIDSTRGNSRSVKREFGLSRMADDYQTVNAIDAASITDNYWIKAEDDPRTYDDIKFYKNDYFGLSLMSDTSSLPLGKIRNPELTNIGSREKGWRLEDGDWWLYKNQPGYENLSEYISYRLGKLLGYSMAHYELVENGQYIRSCDFTEQKYNLQHIDYLVSDHYDGDVFVAEDDLDYNLEAISDKLGERYAREYTELIILDGLVENGDRHVKNYGVLTDRSTGELISMAPNYDNNQSLLYNGNMGPERSGGYLSYVTGFISRNGIRFDPKVREQDVREIIRDAAENSSYEFDQEFLYRYISAGLDKLLRASA